MNNQAHRIGIAVKALVIAASIAAVWLWFPYTNAEEVTKAVASAGAAGPIVFIVITVFKPVIFFLPSLGLTIVAGTLFGPVYGTIYVVIGGAGSTIVGFYTSRWLAGERLRRFLSSRKHLVSLDERMCNAGFRTTLMLRIFNLPWDVVSYAAGLSSMRFRDFYLASLIAIAPVSVIFVYFGSTVTQAGSAGFFIALALIFVTGALPHIYKRYFKRQVEHVE